MIPSWLKVTLPCTKGAFPHIAHIFAKCKYYNFSCNEQNKKDINKEYSEKHNEQQLALLVPKLQVTLLPLVLPSQGQVLLLLHTMSPVRGSHLQASFSPVPRRYLKSKVKGQNTLWWCIHYVPAAQLERAEPWWKRKLSFSGLDHWLQTSRLFFSK